MNARVRVRGLKEAAAKIEAMARAGGQNLVSGLRVVGEEINTDVKAARPGAGVPVDTGALRSSGQVVGPDTQGKVEIRYGGAAAPYAVRQHEELNYRHDVGEARYLTRALERWEAGNSPEQALGEMLDATIAAGKRA